MPYFGAGLDEHYTGTKSPGDNNSALNAYAALIGKQPSIEVWGHSLDGYGPYTNEFNISRNAGKIPLMTMGFDTPHANFCDYVVAGGYDTAMINEYITPILAFGNPCILRPMWEMSGGWYQWGVNVNGNTPAKYVAAWRHIVDLFRAQGATKVSWYWCCYVPVVGGTALSTYDQFWPGDAWVDFAGFDAYPPDGSSVTAWGLMQPVYDKIRSFTLKPQLIGEWGARDDSPNQPTVGKAAWITDFFNTMKTRMPLIKGHCYYDVSEPSQGGALGWPINSSPSATAAYAAGVAQSDHVSNIFSGLTGSTIPIPDEPAAGLENYLNLTTGQGASTLHLAALNSGTATLDFRAKLALTSWASGSPQTVIAQTPAAGSPTNYHWYFGVEPTGVLYVDWVNSAAGFPFASSTAATGFAAGSKHWVRALVTITAGTVDFYTSSDGVTWTPLGTQITGKATVGLQSITTTPVTIGVHNGSDPLIGGKVYRAQLLVGGVSTLDMDFAASTVGAGPWTATTGETWTRTGTPTVLAGSFAGARVAGAYADAPPPAWYLVGPPTSYLNVPGTGSASTPNQPAVFTTTGTYDVRVKVALTSYAFGPAWQSLMGQTGIISSGNFRWDLVVSPSGVLRWLSYSTGIVNHTYDADTAVGVANGNTVWLRCLYQPGVSSATFFKSLDDGATWVQLGSVISQASTDILTAPSPPPVKIGTDAFPNQASGKFYRAQLLIDGVLKLDMNFQTASTGAGPWTATSGETWTAAASAVVVGVADLNLSVPSARATASIPTPSYTGAPTPAGARTFTYVVPYSIQSAGALVATQALRQTSVSTPNSRQTRVV